MPLTGSKPKPEGQKVTRHPLTTEWTEVINVPYCGERPSPGRLPKVTQDWWNDISCMPHCINWTPQQWRFAIDTARVHSLAFRPKGRTPLIAEVRTREKQLGVTADQLRDLRIRYVDPPAEETADAVAGGAADFEAERRRRLMEAD